MIMVMIILWKYVETSMSYELNAEKNEDAKFVEKRNAETDLKLA